MLFESVMLFEHHKFDTSQVDAFSLWKMLLNANHSSRIYPESKTAVF